MAKEIWLTKDGIGPKKSVDFIRGVTPVDRTPIRVKLQRGISVESRASVIKSTFTQLYENRNANLLSNYFMGNEFHGIRQALGANNRLTQILWFLVVFVICAFAISSGRRVVSEYLSGQTQTSYIIKHVKRLQFPSVIVCPKNPDALKMDKVEDDIRRYIPTINNQTLKELIGYAIADAGFQNMDKLIKNITTNKRHGEMIKMLTTWRGNRTIYEFYTDLFERNGYRCDELFLKCLHGAEPVPCCQLFSQHYVMLRGRCFRLDTLYQTDPDYQGRLYVGMNQLPSPLIEKKKVQPQIIAYLADPGSEISTFPRYYLNGQAYNYISISMRKIQMLPTSSYCYDSDETHGRSACYVGKWLHIRLIEPHNCTVFYMHYRKPSVGICEHGIVPQNYDDFQSLTMNESNGSKCLPSCCRHDRRYKLYTNEIKQRRPRFTKSRDPFTLEIGYRDLEYEFYEEFKTTTVLGFISEMGGQFGLFAGVTIITVIQLVLNLLILSWKHVEKLWDFLRT